MNISFLIRHNKSNRDFPTIIYFHTTIGGQKFRYSTGLRVRPSHWDVKKQRVRDVIAEPNRDIINARLREWEDTLRRFALEASLKEPLSVKALKCFLDGWTKPNATPSVSGKYANKPKPQSNVGVFPMNCDVTDIVLCETANVN